MGPYDHTKLHNLQSVSSISNAAVIAFVTDAPIDYPGSSRPIVTDYIVGLG